LTSALHQTGYDGFYERAAVKLRHCLFLSSISISEFNWDLTRKYAMKFLLDCRRHNLILL